MQKNAFANHGIPNIWMGKSNRPFEEGVLAPQCSPGLPIISPLTDKVHTVLCGELKLGLGRVS